MLLPVILAIAVFVTFAGQRGGDPASREHGSGLRFAGRAMSASMSHSAQDLAASRAKGPHTSMFLRMLVRAAVLRRGRALSALFAMVVAAAVATAMLNLYVDVQAKLRREFRNYGANIILVAKDGGSLPADALSQVDSLLAGRGIAAPFALVVAEQRWPASRGRRHGF